MSLNFGDISGVELRRNLKKKVIWRMKFFSRMEKKTLTKPMTTFCCMPLFGEVYQDIFTLTLFAGVYQDLAPTAFSGKK